MVVKEFTFKFSDQIDPVEFKMLCGRGLSNKMGSFVTKNDLIHIQVMLKDAREINDTILQSFIETCSKKNPTRLGSREAMIQLIEWALIKISACKRPTDQAVVESIYSSLPRLRGEA